MRHAMHPGKAKQTPAKSTSSHTVNPVSAPTVFTICGLRVPIKSVQWKPAAKREMENIHFAAEKPRMLTEAMQHQPPGLLPKPQTTILFAFKLHFYEAENQWVLVCLA